MLLSVKVTAKAKGEGELLDSFKGSVWQPLILQKRTYLGDATFS